MYNGDNYSSGDVLAIAVDSSDGSYQFYKNGAAVSVGVGTVTTENGIYIGGDNKDVDNALAFNFGQQPWVYGPPEGYMGLCQSWGLSLFKQLEKAFEQEQQKNRILTQQIQTLQS